MATKDKKVKKEKSKKVKESKSPKPSSKLVKALSINEKLTLPKGLKWPPKHSHSKASTSTRNICYRGKEISVKTTYEILIDKKPLKMHIEVMDDGAIHCHGLPNYSFPSAIDMAKAIIDNAQTDFPKDELGKGKHSHGGH